MQSNMAILLVQKNSQDPMSFENATKSLAIGPMVLIRGPFEGRAGSHNFARTGPKWLPVTENPNGIENFANLNNLAKQFLPCR
jgi:hypothetical protein